MRKFAVAGVLGLLAIGLAGCMALFNQPPVASFTWTPREPYAAQVVIFDASISSDPDRCDEITEYLWDFGDGTKASGVIVRHTYADDGTYSVRLTVKDKFGKEDTLAKQITILNPSPVVKRIDIYDYNGPPHEAGDRLRFSVEALDPASLGLKSIVQVKWEFGDGSAPAYGRSIDHCYSQGCRYYLVRVTVTDDDGDEAPLEEEVFIRCKDGCPTAVIQVSPSEIHKDNTVVLNGRASHDNDRCCVPCPTYRDCSDLAPTCNGCYCDGTDRIVSWRWEIFPPIGGSIIRWGARIEFVPTQTGSYLIQLSVKDDENNWDTVTKQIEVLP